MGRGLPAEFAQIKPGDTAVDLGSATDGNRFVAREQMEEIGRLIGLDLTKKMITKANGNEKKSASKNVDFLLGDIENMPLENEPSRWPGSNLLSEISAK